MRAWAVMSRPMVGSSRNSTLGRCSRPAASSHFMRSPSERLRTGLCMMGASSSSSSSSFEGALVFVVGDAVDRLVEQEGIGGGDVPGEAVALAHHQGHRRR